MIEQSADISELAKALCKAQAAMGGAKKDSENPFFKSKYADLESVWAACRGPLTDNGLSVTQFPSGVIGDARAWMTTQLMHSSGQWMRASVPLSPAKNDPQGIGSALTYMRRYAVSGVTGIHQTDDDGEAAHGRGTARPPTRKLEASASNTASANGGVFYISEAVSGDVAGAYVQTQKDGTVIAAVNDTPVLTEDQRAQVLIDSLKECKTKSALQQVRDNFKSWYDHDELAERADVKLAYGEVSARLMKVKK